MAVSRNASGSLSMSAAIKHAACSPWPKSCHTIPNKKTVQCAAARFVWFPLQNADCCFTAALSFVFVANLVEKTRKKIPTFATSTMAAVKGNKKEQSFAIFITLRVTTSFICACAPPFFSFL